MEPFVAKLRQDYPKIQFVKGVHAVWSPRANRITYEPDESAAAVWTVLHELGHALLGHDGYESDANLLHKEVVAWTKAKQLAKNYGISIADEHIEQCLDTYREWLYKRSSCPTCSNHGIQRSERLYNCLNCADSWQVNIERFCRPYRLKKRLQ